MTVWSGEGGDEFADFVRARQHQLRRAAHLLTGDFDRGDAALARAFGELARRWSSLGDESPDVVVRQALYRRAAPLGPDRGAAATGASGASVLAGLDHRDRALAVLRLFEERGEGEVAEILGRSAASVRHHPSTVTRDALMDETSDVGEKDFVDLARGEAAALRRRTGRRVLSGIVAVGLVVGLVAWLGRDTTEAEAQSPPPERSAAQEPAAAESAGEWDRRGVDLFGVEGQIGPTAAQVRQLPKVDDLTRGQLALPESLGLPATTDLPTLSSVGANSAPVRAVLLRWAGEGWNPVLYRPTLTAAPYTVVDDIVLQPTVAEDGGEADPLEPRAVADDRRRVLFVQSGQVLVLDAFSAKVTRVAVPDRYLFHGGWAPDGSSAIVWSASDTWRVTMESAAARRITTAYIDTHRVTVEPPDGMRVRTFRADGSTLSTAGGPRVLGGVLGETFSGDGGGHAVAGWVSPAAAGLLGVGSDPDTATCVVHAAGGQTPGRGRLLVAPLSIYPACGVVGWAFADDVLVGWGGDLLAWDTRTGDLSWVAALHPDQGAPDSPVSFALAFAP